MFEVTPVLSGVQDSVRAMEQLTDNERTEWIDDATDALRGRMIIRRCDAAQAYTELARERAWRHNALTSSILREAYEKLPPPRGDTVAPDSEAQY